jgi:predicted alpha/beta-hydrolase family hydrolase
MPNVQPFSDSSGLEAVRGFLHIPDAAASPSAGLVLTHSAGSNCQAPLLVVLAEAFSAAGWFVLRCDLPFRQQRPSGPPMRTALKDQAGLQAAVDSLRRRTKSKSAEGSAEGSGGRIYLGGHSYGGRMASMLAADHPELVDALLLLSYPLHPPKQPQQMRTKHFPELKTPALFVSGAHDGFGSIPELESAAALIPGRTAVLPVPGAGHELLSKASREILSRLVVDAFLRFVSPNR